MRAIRILLLDKQTRLESAPPIIETGSDGSTQELATKATNLSAENLLRRVPRSGQSWVFLPGFANLAAEPNSTSSSAAFFSSLESWRRGRIKIRTPPQPGTLVVHAGTPRRGGRRSEQSLCGQRDSAEQRSGSSAV